MLVTIAEIVNALHQQKKNCVVVFNLVNDERLFKIYVRGGDICSLSLGTLHDAECLNAFRSLQFKKYTFIPEAAERLPAGRLNAAEAFANMGKSESTVCGGADSVFGSTIRIDPVDDGVLAQLEEAVVEIAGPVAGHILEECFGKVGYIRGAKLSPGALRRLTNLLADDLPPEDRPVFLAKSRRYNA